MKVVYKIEDVEEALTNISESIVCIGNFDGCHLGHQKLLKHISQESKKAGLPSIVLSFDPSPKIFFDPNQTLNKLFTIEQKIHAFREAGIDLVVMQTFDKQFSSISPEEFLILLKSKLKCRSLFVGENFRFGANRAGDISLLKATSGIKLNDLPVEPLENKVISSTRIREALDQGNLELVNRLLGRPYSISGVIAKGQQLGRTISFPTANLHKGRLCP